MPDLNKNKNRSVLETEISRRKLLTMGLVTVAASIIPYKTLAAVNEVVTPGRSLSLFNVYSKETLNVVYWFEGKYLPDALARINHMFRDVRTGRVKKIDIHLIDLLFGIQKKLKCKDPFHIISGYRTPRSNAILRKRKKGVARNSLHMYGKAVDISLPGYNLRALRRAAMKLKSGGVGYYPRSRFVHLDVGKVRYWWG
jgi:uncharacterized protein YcbK (DUF882 family)